MRRKSDKGEGNFKRLDPPGEERRNYLKTAGALVVGLAVGGAAGWLSKPAERVEVPGVTVTAPGATVTVPGATETVTKTVTVPVTPTPTPIPTISTEELIELGLGAFEPATKPLAEPKDWTSPPPEYRDKDEIVIGTSMPLTGIFSWASTWQKLKEDWAEDINKRGGLLGLPVRIICLDDGSDTSRAISNFIKLIEVDKVDLLFSGCPTPTMVPVMNAIDKYGYNVLLSGSSDYEGFVTANNGRGWNGGFEIQIEAEFFHYHPWPYIESLPKDIRPKKVAILYGEYSPFTVHGAKGTRYFAEQAGLEVVYEAGYPTDVTDYTPLVNGAKAAGADMLVSCSTALDPTKMILEAMRLLDYQPKIFDDFNVLYPGFMDETGEHTIPLAYYTMIPVMHWPTWADPPFKDVARWCEAYKEICNVPFPFFDSAWGSFECQILEQAVQSTGSLDHEILREYLMTHSFYTLNGRIEFDERKIIRGFVMATGMIDSEGKEQVIWPEELATAEAIYPRPPWGEY